MKKEVDIKIWPDEWGNDGIIHTKIITKLKGHNSKSLKFKLVKKSIDARKGRPFFILRYQIIEEQSHEQKAILDSYETTHFKPEVVIIGAGPAGYFAALQCIEMGLKPIVVDRGKDVQMRRRDLRAIQQFHKVDPDSNYCFGEGGAGTYSDGKLYTRSHKRGKIEKVLQLLVEHGAKSDILYEAHPHIGSNKLPKIISNIRETILKFGGEIHFDTKIVDFEVINNTLESVIDSVGIRYRGKAFILATGHSARDIFELLDRKNISIEAKPFAMGVRVEHPQKLIDEIQYRQKPREEGLPAASYKLVRQINECGVFSFCMCPGGLIVPAATAPGEIVVNGMSLSRRDSAFANSGVVTAIELNELEQLGYTGKFAGLEFQKDIEQKVFKMGDGSQKAASQRLADYCENKDSNDLPDSSYIPGLNLVSLQGLFPEAIDNRLRIGLRAFDRIMKGYYTNEAIVVATESRTSSPIRIPRNENCMHPEIVGLFPCGEGAGYAGGILSAAMDGQNVVKAIHGFLS